MGSFICVHSRSFADCLAGQGAYNTPGSRPDNRRRASGGGKSGLRRAVCQLTAGRREPTESATENEPPKSRKGPARVKRCGKSAPRPWQQGRHGKPHTEQGQIGKDGCAEMRGPTRGPRAFRVGCWRRRVTAVLEEWLSRHRKVPDRTRLIGRLPTFPHGGARIFQAPHISPRSGLQEAGSAPFAG